MLKENSQYSWSERLNNVKWILTLLIVLYHIQLIGEYSSLEGKVFLYIKNLGDCVVTSFGLISGFLFFYNVSSYSDIINKMRRRIKTLIIPYFLWNVINSAFVIVRSYGIRNISTGIKNFNPIRNLVLWDSSPHFWYVFMLIFWTLTAPLLYTFIKDIRLLLVLLSLQLLYFCFKGSEILTSRYIYVLYTWGGIVGVYFPGLPEKITTIETKRKRIVSILFISAYILIRFVYNDVTENGVLVWCYGVRSLCLIIGLMCATPEIIGNKTNYRYMFWLFAVHYWMDSVLTQMISRLLGGVLVVQIIVWLSVVLLSMCMGYLVSRVFPGIFKFLVGNRNT